MKKSTYSITAMVFLLVVPGCMVDPTADDVSGTASKSGDLSRQYESLCAMAAAPLEAYVQSLPSSANLGAPLASHTEIWSLPYATHDGRRGVWKTRPLAVRWYEKGRVEYHPELAQSADPVKRAYGVQLGLLGVEAALFWQRLSTKQSDFTHAKINWRSPAEPIQAQYPAVMNPVLHSCQTDEKAYKDCGWFSCDAYGGKGIDAAYGFSIYGGDPGQKILNAWLQPGAPLAHEMQAGVAGAVVGDTYESRIARRGNPLSPFCKMSETCRVHTDAQRSRMIGVQVFERTRFEIYSNDDGSQSLFEANLGTELYNYEATMLLFLGNGERWQPIIQRLHTCAGSGQPVRQPLSQGPVNPAPVATETPIAPPAPPEDIQIPVNAPRECKTLIASLPTKRLGPLEVCTAAKFLASTKVAFKKNGGYVTLDALLVEHPAFGEGQTAMEAMASMALPFASDFTGDLKNSVAPNAKLETGTTIFLVLRKYDAGAFEIVRAFRGPG